MKVLIALLATIAAMAAAVPVLAGEPEGQLAEKLMVQVAPLYQGPFSTDTAAAYQAPATDRVHGSTLQWDLGSVPPHTTRLPDPPVQ